MARLLIADGDTVERELLREALVSAGHEATLVADGDEALLAAERGRFDAAIVDVLLPRKDGYTLLLHLRSRDATRALPVIFVSTEPAVDHEAIAMELGAAAYFEKPWSGEALAAAVAEATGAAGAAP